MLKILTALVLLSMAGEACAQEAGVSIMRSPRANSVMFQDQDMRESALFEAEQRRREAYEAQRRAEEQARLEAERRKALRPVNLFGKGLKIFAEINGEVITSRDMQERVNAFVATTQIPVNNQTKAMIIDRVLQAAVDEKIKLQEAEKNGVQISDKELKAGMESFAKANNVSVEKLRQMFKEAQVSEKVFRQQMKAEMAWTRLVQRKAAQEVLVSQGEIEDAMDVVKKDIQTPKFMVSEIVIPLKQAAHIQDLVDNLRQDPRFELYAMQFSQSPSARNGGRLGWINKGQLAEPLEKSLTAMNEGAVSNPIKLGSDYYILRLEKVYRPGVDKAPVPSEAEIKNMLENKKMEEIAAKYIRDLRQKAVIDRKV